MNPYVYALQDQVFQNFIQRKLKHVYGLLSVSDFDLKGEKGRLEFWIFRLFKTKFNTLAELVQLYSCPSKGAIGWWS